VITSVGITASRHGLSDIQRRALTTFLHRARMAGASRFHHGCCVGGDEIGAVIAYNLGYRVIGHPPVKTELVTEAFSHELRESKGYLERDRDIVHETDVLIGLPNQPEVWRGSGTWFTVHYAQEMSRARLVMLPNGQVVERIRIDDLYPVTQGEVAPRTAITDRQLGGGS
jgi:hypothetical protein